MEPRLAVTSKPIRVAGAARLAARAAHDGAGRADVLLNARSTSGSSKARETEVFPHWRGTEHEVGELHLGAPSDRRRESPITAASGVNSNGTRPTM
jgi:hypothetical protein